MSFGSSAQVLDWTHSHEEIQKLSALLGASQALLAAADFKRGLQSVLETLSVCFGALSSRVVLLNQETGEIDVEASSGRRLERAKPVRHGFRESIVGDAVRNGKPIVVPVARPEVRFPTQMIARSSGREKVTVATPSSTAKSKCSNSSVNAAEARNGLTTGSLRRRARVSGR